MRVVEIVLAVAFVGMCAARQSFADEAKAPAAPKAAAETVVTGQHRGFTNDTLFLKRDDGTEIKLVVAIPGVTEDKWHQDYEMMSRITVTYHLNADGKLVATAIKAADAKSK